MKILLCHCLYLEKKFKDSIATYSEKNKTDASKDGEITCFTLEPNVEELRNELRRKFHQLSARLGEREKEKQSAWSVFLML